MGVCVSVSLSARANADRRTERNLAESLNREQLKRKQGSAPIIEPLNPTSVRYKILRSSAVSGSVKL